MGFDPELLKQLVGTFKTELEEQLQIITNGLLKLEKPFKNDNEREKTVTSILRAAHNIKGASRGLGILEVGDIAHHVETLFSSIQQKTTAISSDLIDLCLEAVDKMRAAMQAFLHKSALTFNLPDFLKRLEGTKEKTTIEKKTQRRKKTQSAAQVDSTPQEERREHDSIRVFIENIERISASMEEMQVNKIALDDHYTELKRLALKTDQLAEFWRPISSFLKIHMAKETNANLPKIYEEMEDSFLEVNNMTQHLYKTLRNRINELTILSNSMQDEIRMLRLVPLSNLLCTMPRYIRDLSHQLGKQIELKITGDEVKIDKMVLERLKDPIIHLLRNCVDHGIESPDIRAAEGKSATGIISIDIHEEGGQIHIAITDDGAGINGKKVAELALKKGLVSKEELNNMSEKEILELIFKPGFSAKEIITTVSGRGIGLDVVKTNIGNLNGQINVKTAVGEGTTFDLAVPLTLASQRGLMIVGCDELFVIPTYSVERVLNISTAEVLEVEGTQVIMFDGHPVPLHTLGGILDLEQKKKPLQDRLSIIVIKKDWKPVAILVDEIIGEREIVVKPLHSPLTNVPCVAGGTLFGSNQVIIILNPNDLINRALHMKKTHKINFHDDKAKLSIKPHILVVDDSITTRTLEKNILESKNYQVTVAVNGKEAWDLLQKQKFSLLITDIIMPIMDGFTLTERVKQSEQLRNLPIIIVTSLESDQEKKRGIDAGANAYIVKNEFESGALLEIVKQLI